MNYKFMMVLNALVALALGLVFLVVPKVAFGFFGTEDYGSTLLTGRLFGAVMTTVGLLLWFAKNVEAPKVQRGLSMAMFIGSFLSLVVYMIGSFDVFETEHVIRENGLIAIVVYLFFTLGYAFLVFLKPKMKE